MAGLVPAIALSKARLCLYCRDRRDQPGDGDESERPSRRHDVELACAGLILHATLRGGTLSVHTNKTEPRMQLQTEATRPPVAGVLHGSRIIAEIKASGVEFIPCLPDIHTSEGLLRPLTREPGVRLIRVCKEDEGVGICAGLSYCNKRALLLMQYTGLLDSINAIRAVAVEYSLPICMMAGLLQKEPGVPPRASKHFGVRIAGPVLDALGVEHHVIETDADVGQIRPAIEAAYAHQHPVVLFIGGRPVS